MYDAIAVWDAIGMVDDTVDTPGDTCRRFEGMLPDIGFVQMGRDRTMVHMATLDVIV